MAGRPSLACYAVTPPGLEALSAGELAGLGLAADRLESGGASFRATPAGLYAANLRLRTVNRILVRLAEFPARGFSELERKAKRIPWELVLRPGAPAAFRVTSRKSKLYHQDAIAERLVAACGGAAEYPDNRRDAEDAEDAEDADGTDGTGAWSGSDGAAQPAHQLFVVRVMRDVVTVSADSSGELLHRRGYRLQPGKAPLRETLAAGMLLAAGYDGSRPLVDPFSGSGTIPIEAALLARRIPPGHQRRFAFEHWPSFEPEAWRNVRSEAAAAMLDRAPAPIRGTDRDEGAVAAGLANAARAGVAGDVTFRRATISELEPPEEPGFLVSNPPYGVRVGEVAGLRDLYARLGQVVRERCPGWTAAILTARPEHRRATGLHLEPAWRSSSGGVKVELGIVRVPGR